MEQLVGLIIKKEEMKQGFWHRRECFKWCFKAYLTMPVRECLASAGNPHDAADSGA
ncbi:hypothetical protein [Paenibacillus sp. MMO-177]|uniref:hypothetical protein n=1 Tax=Paenibacillus sp. MMO-177 TaxID=3081289 RepID=UPI0030178634